MKEPCFWDRSQALSQNYELWLDRDKKLIICLSTNIAIWGPFKTNDLPITSQFNDEPLMKKIFQEKSFNKMTPKLYQKTSVIQSTDFRKTVGNSIVKRSTSPVISPEAVVSYLTRNAELIDCPICGEQTMNHFHYGGVACDSCKAFFRRTAVSPSKKSAKCRTGLGNCLLKLERRNNCPYCRFQKCLQNGMNPNLIKCKPKQLTNPQTPSIPTVKEESSTQTSVVFSKFLSNDEKLTQILQYHKLVLSQTDGVNLMTVPEKFLPLIQRNHFEANSDPNTNEDIKIVAEIENIFLTIKSEFLRESTEKFNNFLSENVGPAQLFLKVQVKCFLGNQIF